MKKRLPIVLLLICAILFALGIVQLFKLRFEAGDVYPEYSSLRADPLGSMALYESLGRLTGLSVRRDFSAANQLPDGKKTTYLHLAGKVHEWKELPEATFKEISAFLAGGGRLVITFFPETAKPYRFDRGTKEDKTKTGKSDEPEKTKPEKQPARKKKLKDGKDDGFRFVSLKDRWGVDFGFTELDQNIDTYEPAEAENKTLLALPQSVSWHSATIFTNLDEAWKTIYARGAHPVVVERKFGAGSVVLASDTYFVSNEAMRAERHADFLAWLVGPNPHVIFDEAHFGVLEAPGIAALVRKYRLHGLIAGFLLLAGLFIWKNAASLAPPYADEKQEDYVRGKDFAAGFVNLLRRNVASRDVLGVCLGEWNKSFARPGKYSAVKQQRVQAVIDAESALSFKDRDPVKTYQTVCRILKESSGIQVSNDEANKK